MFEHKKSHALRLGLLCAGLFSINACGGSGSGNTAPARPAIPPVTPVTDSTQPSPLQTTSGINLYGDSNISSGDSVGFALIAANSEINQVSWQQTAGAPLTIQASHSQTIGFDVPSSGSYTLQAQVRLANGQQSTITHSFSVSESSAAKANIRLDHNVTERSKVSLRVDADLNIADAAISWEQLYGPSAGEPEIQENRLFFNVPNVDNDQIIVYRATLTYASGEQLSDDVFVSVNNTNINTDGYFFGNDIVTTEDMFVFNPQSPYQDAVEACVYNNQIAATCTFGRLPLIGQQTNSPSTDDILDRTLVSHAWMGERFKQYLNTSVVGEDMRMLLRGVTAVVISYDVRPSFYWAATGAIYLDANNFWQSPEERDTLNEQPDYRSGFGGALDFIVPWRYVKNNAYYPNGAYPSAQRGDRSFSDLEADISWLMYHELGHANDFFPPSSWASISSSDDPLSSFRNNGTNSDILLQRYPLSSTVLKELAQVSFAGIEATAQQKAYNGDDLAPLLSTDTSPAYYSYLNEREDFATLFERFMMSYRLGAHADIALITRSNNDDLIVSWGQRDRFNDPSLQARVRFAVERVLPELGDVAALQTTLPSPIDMDVSKGWFDNLRLSQNVSQSSMPEQGFNKERLRQDLNRDQHLHIGVPKLPQH